jgi:hypothetical protein
MVRLEYGRYRLSDLTSQVGDCILNREAQLMLLEIIEAESDWRATIQTCDKSVTMVMLDTRVFPLSY